MSRNSRRPMSTMFGQAVETHKEEEIARLKAEISQLQASQGQSEQSSGFVLIPVSQVVPLRLPDNLKQPRRYFDPDKLAKLRDSISKHGRVLEPILVRRATDSLYETISGERRWRCSVELGLATIAAMVVEMDDQTALEVALIAHLLSEDISAIEETDSIMGLLKLRLNKTFEQVKQFLITIKNYQARGDGTALIETHSSQVAIVEAILEEFNLKISSFVSNRIPLLNLSPVVLEAVRAGELSPTGATLINRAPIHLQAELVEFGKGATKTQLQEKLAQLKQDVLLSSPESGSGEADDNSGIIIADTPVQERVYSRIRDIRKRKTLLADHRVQSHLAQVDSVLAEIEAIAREKGIPL